MCVRVYFLVVYVDDIVVTIDDYEGIKALKQNLFKTFKLRTWILYVGVETAQSKSGLVISQRKYTLIIQEDTCHIDCKPLGTLMNLNVKLILNQRSLDTDD